MGSVYHHPLESIKACKALKALKALEALHLREEIEEED